MSVRLFVDYLSQPSRAVSITFSMLNVPFEVQLINIMKGEHKTEEFA
jgi:glutathione S-transferase